MLRNLRKYLFLLPYCLLIVAIILISLGTSQWRSNMLGDEEGRQDEEQRFPLSMFDGETFLPDSNWQDPNPVRFRNDLDPTLFLQPPQSYGPLLRWWWPGAWVDSIQLGKELTEFAEKGFGGVDIQALSVGLDPDMKHWDLVNQHDSEKFYELIRECSEKAHELGMSVDLSLSALSPVGGKQVDLEEGIQSLAFAEATVLGGKVVDLQLPEPNIPYFYQWFAWEELFIPSANDQWAAFRKDKLELLEVFAAKTLDEKRSEYAIFLDDYVELDPDSTFIITDFVKDNRIIWNASSGYWKIIAVYKHPAAQNPWAQASKEKGYVISPFNAQKVLANNNYLLGQRTKIPPLYGKGFRGFSQAPFEYLAERLFTPEILEYFKKKNAYELTPFLPILAVPAHDNHLLDLQIPLRGPEYILTEADQQIRDDYQKSLSDFFIENYLDSTQVWAESRGLVSRIIPYGFRFDIIKAAGHSNLPEASQYYSGYGSRFIKMISSGAELYGRPWVSSLCLDGQEEAFANSLSSWKEASDELFLNGVNHLVFQGAPYEKIDAKYGKESWMPFSSPFFDLEHFSEHLGKSNPYWRFQDELNMYIRRCQYLLRKGKSNASILIYYPFLGFPAKKGSEYQGLQSKGLAEGSLAEAEWLENVNGLIQALEELGLDWIWVNDESLQKARVKNNQISIGKNDYERLILIDVPSIEIQTLRNIEKLSTGGAEVLILDNPPAQVKGYLNFEAHMQELDQILIQLPKAIRLDSKEDIQNYFSGFPIKQKISFARPYEQLRAKRRQGPDFDLIFLKNEASKDRFYELRIDLKHEYNYIFNPWRGSIHKMDTGTQGIHRIFLNTRSTAFILSSENEWIDDSLLSKFNRLDAPLIGELSLNTRNIERWDFLLSDESGNSSVMELNDTLLLDWSQDPILQYASEEALYRSSFMLGDTLENKSYILDLGEINGIVEVKLNTESVGDCIIPPFRLDISKQISPGFNTIEIWLTSPLKNRLIGRAVDGDERYKRYLNQIENLDSYGLKGPVLIWEVDKSSELIN